jgi:serine phosphatase RsbU (regulator of sigma subunit)
LKIKSKILLTAFVGLLFCQKTLAQVPFSLTDSLKKIELSSNDEEKILINFHLEDHYIFSKSADSALIYLNNIIKIAKDGKYEKYLLPAYTWTSLNYLWNLGNYPLGLAYAFEALKSKQNNSKNGYKFSNSNFDVEINMCYYTIAAAYANLGNKDKAIEFINKLDSKYTDTLYLKGNTGMSGMDDANHKKAIAQLYRDLKDYDKVKLYVRKIFEQNKVVTFDNYIYVIQGDLLMHEKKYEDAIKSYQVIIKNSPYDKDIMESAGHIAESYMMLGKTDSAIKYSNMVIDMSNTYRYTIGILAANKLLFEIYKKLGKQDSAIKYITKYELLRDSEFDNIKVNEVQNQILSDQLKEEEAQKIELNHQRNLNYAIGVAILFFIGLYLFLTQTQKRKIKRAEENRRIKELQAARDLQLSMLPKKVPQRDDLDIATFIRSSTEVGGDYYDFFEHKGTALYSICGDATGHGVASGMMVSVTKAGLNGIEALPVNNILYKLNNIIKSIDLGTLRMSLNIVQFKPNEFELSSAAMPPVYHYVAATQKVEEILIQGIPLGGLKDEQFETITRSFNTGDIIVQLSDGFPEAPDLNGEMYDYDRLRLLIEDNGQKSAKELINVLMASVDVWLQGEHNPDDITLVVSKKI